MAQSFPDKSTRIILKKFANNVEYLLKAGCDVHARPSDHRLCPFVLVNNQIREDYRAAMTNRNSRLGSGAARFTGLDNNGGKPIARHSRVSH